MKLKTYFSNPSSLNLFLSNIKPSFLTRGFQEVFSLREADLHFVQIHGSPRSIKQDMSILEFCLINKSPMMICLVHRPDELVLYPELVALFSKANFDKVILLGDFVPNLLKESTNSDIVVIAHPYTDLNRPDLKSKVTFGSFTSFGEMRSLDHCCRLFKEIYEELGSQVNYQLGGLVNDRPLSKQDLKYSFIELKEELFYPHFNFQLFHLNGSKRFAESSGALHRGISIPVIFEANGIERVEGVKVIKVNADDALQKIDFAKTVQEVARLIRSGDYKDWLDHNMLRARENTPDHFALAVQKILK